MVCRLPPSDQFLLPTQLLRACAYRADFVYMAPPFIAYFGALQGGDGGQALLQIAYDQIRLYRDALFDADVSLWRHVALGSWEDSGHWATGAQIVNLQERPAAHALVQEMVGLLLGRCVSLLRLDALALHQ